MNYPKIKFLINKEKDLEVFNSFNNETEYNPETLNWAFLNKYPELLKYKKNTCLEINEIELINFINSIYEKNKETINTNILKYEKNWELIEEAFYNLVNNIFNSCSWPNGKYIAYLTIWGMYPRFLDDKTFCIPYLHKNEKYVNVVIAHEMLHFVFYDYFYKKYPEYNNSEYNFFVWNISEIFNSLIQNSNEWIKVFKEQSMTYLQHDIIINKIRDLKINNIDLLIEKIISEVNNI